VDPPPETSPFWKALKLVSAAGRPRHCEGWPRLDSRIDCGNAFSSVDASTCDLSQFDQISFVRIVSGISLHNRKEENFAGGTISIRPDRCTMENLRLFDQISIHIDQAISQYPIRSVGEREHRCPRTDSPLGGARWFERDRPSPTSTFDPATNALKSGRMFSTPGLLIGKPVHEFVDLSEQRTRVAHPRRET
jgi:hypothetical protein